jgi:toxin ParE1/3/4
LKYIVEVRGAAERDVAEAMDWYEAQVPGLGVAFLEDFAQVLGRIAVTPLIYQVIYRESRRAQLRRFPYVVWFKVQDQLVTVRACLRGSINPAKMRRRLR